MSLILNKFDHLEFKDYNSWVWIEPLILLKNRVSNEKIREYKQDVLHVLNIGNDLQRQVKRRTFSRLLKGETLYEEKIEEARISNDLISEGSYLLGSIMKLVVISEMGGSDEFSVETSEQLMKEYISRFLKITY